MKDYKIQIEKENELYFDDIISKEAFKISVFQWRYKKKIDKFLDRLQNKIVEKHTGSIIDKNVKFTIE